MRSWIVSAVVIISSVASIGAAPTDVVTKADLKAIIERLDKLEKENKAQAERIAELEAKNRSLAAVSEKVVVEKEGKAPEMEKGTSKNETGRVYTAQSGRKYFLADKFANIFEPLSESGLRIVPHGYLAFEGVYNTHAVDADALTDFVKRRGKGGTTLSMQDSLLGVNYSTPESLNGWTFSGKA